MEDIIKISIVATVCCICVLLIRQYRPELSLFAQIAGLIAVFILGMPVITQAIEYCRDIISDTVIDKGYLTLLVKALGIAIISRIGGDLCRDSGNSVLAFAVELATKGMILLLSLPMLKSVVDVATGLLKG